MSETMHDDIEPALRRLFERQAEAMRVGVRDWDDPVVATLTTIEQRHRGRTLMAIGAVAASIMLIVGFAAVASGGKRVRVAGSPEGSPTNPVHFETQQVAFDASTLRIEANGRAFTTVGSKVDVHSDPGDAHYQTLELAWQEHGVEMRLYVYFAADAHDWWATSIATYNGKAQGDWIAYAGERFRTSLGSAFTGTVDLRPTDGQSGHLTITDLRLEAFRRPAVCATQTGTYAIESNEGDAIDLTAEPGNGYNDTVTLLDRATCTAVPARGRFGYRFTSGAPDVVDAEGLACPNGLPADYCDTHSYVSFTARAPGEAIVHVAALDLRTGKTVAQADVRITVRH